MIWVRREQEFFENGTGHTPNQQTDDPPCHYVVRLTLPRPAAKRVTVRSRSHLVLVMGRTELQPGLSPRANVTEQAASAIDDNRKMRLRPSGFDTVRATLRKIYRKHFDGTAIAVVQQKTGTHVCRSSLGCVFGRL